MLAIEVGWLTSVSHLMLELCHVLVRLRVHQRCLVKRLIPQRLTTQKAGSILCCELSLRSFSVSIGNLLVLACP